MNMQKYKALMLDVDGTLIPYQKDALPSEKVTAAVKEASKYVHICIASGRPYFMLTHLIEHFGLHEGLLVMNDGAQVMDIRTKEYHYKKVMHPKDVKAASSILKKEGISFFLNDGQVDSPPTQIPIKREILNIFTLQRMLEEKADGIITKLTQIPTIKASKTHEGGRGTYELLISHAEATKLHGITEAAKILGVKRHEIIGVGDSGNDFPLLMASGLKVAMGNAIPGLKDVADYIAPPVEKDGVADVIEKFILPPNRH